MVHITGIYKIENIKNHKCYYGSAVDVVRRWRGHKSDLSNNIHHSLHLQRAWLKYGEESFVWQVIEECSEEKLIEREQFWLDTVRTRNQDQILGEIDKKLSYNVCPIANSVLGFRHSEESNEKNRVAHTGEKNHNFGKHLSEEAKKKLSEALMGKMAGENNPMFGLRGEKHPMFGTHRSEETKRKIGEAQLGEKNHMYGKHLSEETKKKISEAATGRHHSDKSKKKMSEAKIGENNPNAKLIWEKVREIRRRYEEEAISQQKLANEYGITQTTVGEIIRGEIWKDI
jgi:group I intron endonuclease